MMTRRSCALALAVALAAALGACGGDTTGTSADTSAGGAGPSTDPASRDWNDGGAVTIPQPAADAGDGVQIMYSGFGQDNPYAQAQAESVASEAGLYGATSTFVGPTTFDPQAQSSLVCDAASSGRYQIIIMQVIDSASIVPCTQQAVDAGIKVVTIQFPAGPDISADSLQVEGLVTQIREDVLTNARVMADGVIESCEGVDPCEVQVLWGVRSLGFDAVKPAAFFDEIADHDNIEVVCETDANYTEDLGRTQAADCLQAHPDLHVIASQADESVKGAELALEAAGRTFGLGDSDVHLVGSYASHYAVQQIQAGKWVQSYYARPDSDGRAAVDLALLALAGEEVPEDVLTSDLDDIGNVIDASVLEQHPQLTGQW